MKCTTRALASFLISVLCICGCSEDSPTPGNASVSDPTPDVLSASPSEARTPHQTFLAFQAVAVEGGDLEAPMAYLTQSKRKRLEANFDRMIKAGRTREEVLELSRKLAVEEARTYELTLQDEKVEGAEATLTYRMKPRDGESGDATQQIVTLKREQGEWRIDEFEIKF